MNISRKFGLVFLVLVMLFLTACSPQTSTSPPINGVEVSQTQAPADEKPPEVTTPSGSSEEAPVLPQDSEDSGADATPTPPPTPTETTSQTSDVSELTVYFIDVGQADAALVVCDGKTMLIDGGNVADSNLIYSFLKSKDISHLDYIVATHAHEDHVGGLAGALNLAQSVGVAYCPVTSYDTKAFNSFIKYLADKGVSVTVPHCGESFKIGSADVLIAGVDPQAEDPNNSSIVLKITHGEVSFLFTGDAEREAEQNILASGYDLNATVLKVGHHGSDTSTTYPFLREIMPQYAVISVGKDNQYGHPHENTMSRLRDADVTVYRTDMQGDITAVSDGKTVSFTVARNADVETNPTVTDKTPEPEPTTSISPTPSQSDVTYIGNINSKKFHKPSCHTLPAEKNRTYFDSREAAVSAGYDPCGNCKP